MKIRLVLTICALVVGTGLLAGAVVTVRQVNKIVPPQPLPVAMPSPTALPSSASPAQSTGITAQGVSQPLTFAVLGDSFAGAKGADDVMNGWVARLAEGMCWAPGVISAEGGTGFTTAGIIPNARSFVDRVSDITAGQPQAVIVQGGTNDDAAPPQQITDAAGRTFRTLREALPGAAIVAVGPSWAPKKDLADMQRISASIAAAAGTYGILYVDPAGERWLTDPNQFDTDGYHPNNEGHSEFARRLISDLARWGVSPRCAG